MELQLASSIALISFYSTNLFIISICKKNASWHAVVGGMKLCSMADFQLSLFGQFSERAAPKQILETTRWFYS